MLFALFLPSFRLGSQESVLGTRLGGKGGKGKSWVFSLWLLLFYLLLLYVLKGCLWRRADMVASWTKAGRGSQELRFSDHSEITYRVYFLNTQSLGIVRWFWPTRKSCLCIKINESIFPGGGVWHTPLMLALRRQRQANLSSEASLFYRASFRTGRAIIQKMSVSEKPNWINKETNKQANK